MQISHLKTAGPANWHKISAIIDTIEKARAEGLDVSADRYPYTASSTDLDAILPAWAYEGGNAKEVERLQAPETRAKLREEVLVRTSGAGVLEPRDGRVGIDGG